MDEERYLNKMAELLKFAGSVQSSGASKRMALIEVKAICIGHSVSIAHGTGESATQTMARAKDLFNQIEEWMDGEKVRK